MTRLIKVLCAFKPLVTNPVIRFISGFPLIIGLQEIAKHYQEMGFILTDKTLTTITLISCYYFIILPVIGGMTDRIYTFHETKNLTNINKNPLKFAIKHRSKIIILYKSFFIIGLTYPLIMLWFFD